MAQLKGTHGVRGGGSSSRYSSAKSDNSLAAQIARDNAAMAARSTKPTNTYRGYAAQPVKTGTTKATPSRNNSNDGGYSSYLAEQESLKQARLAEYKKIETGIKTANQLFSVVQENLFSVVEIFYGPKLSGKKAEKFIDTIKNGLEGANKIGESLTAIEETATQKEIELGGTPEALNSGGNTKYEPLLKGTYSSSIYSWDTDVLRNLVIPKLDSAEKNAKKAKETVKGLPQNAEGCEEIKNVSPKIDDTENFIKETRKEVEKEIEIAEQTEKKNIGIIDGLTNWITGLFNKKTGDNKKEQSGTYVDLSKHPNNILFEQNKDNSPTIKKEKDPYTARKEDENARHYLGIAAEKNGVETDGKTTEKKASDKAKQQENNKQATFSKDITYENQYYDFDGKRIEGYSLMIPSSYTGEEPLPVIVFLHGLSHANWKPEYFMKNSGIQAVLTDDESLLEKPNAIILSPQLHDGLDTDADHPWNCAESAEELKVLLDYIAATYNIDTNKQTIMRT